MSRKPEESLRMIRTHGGMLDRDGQREKLLKVGLKANVDKATRAMIDSMYRRILSSEKAAEITQSRVYILKNQLVETEEELARAREKIVRLREARPVGPPRGD